MSGDHDEVMVLRSELEKAHRLLSQMHGWQYEAEKVKAIQQQALEQIAGIEQNEREPKPLIFWQDIARRALDRVAQVEGGDAK